LEKSFDEAASKIKGIKAVEKLETSFKDAEKRLNANNTGRTKKLNNDTNKFFQGLENKISKAIKEQRGGMNLIHDKLRTIKNGKDGDRGDDGESVDEEEIKEMILSLIPEAEKIDLSEFEDKIEELLEEIENLKIANVQRGGGGLGNSREAVKFFDLSPELDGVKKKFSLPAFYRILQVDMSSFPTKTRLSIDYTFDSTDMSITFTSEIDAATQLSAGQTIIILYVEP